MAIIQLCFNACQYIIYINTSKISAHLFWKKN